MKKSQLKNIIRESIKKLMTEQLSNYDCHHFMPCVSSPGYSGPPSMQIFPWIDIQWLGAWQTANPNVPYNDPLRHQAYADASEQAYIAMGSPSPYSVTQAEVQFGQSWSQGAPYLGCWKYTGLYSCTTATAANYMWQVTQLGPVTPQSQNSCQICQDSLPAPVSGCTDSNASNYDPNATQDDGSCDYGFYCKDIMPQKPGIAKKCTPGTAQNPGPFETLQDCLASGCEPKQFDKDLEKDVDDTFIVGPAKDVDDTFIVDPAPTNPALQPKKTEPTDKERDIERQRDIERLKKLANINPQDVSRKRKRRER